MSVVAPLALPRRAILLAGGSGSRLRPVSRVVNKHLLLVDDRPMIYYPLATLIEGGVEEVLVVTSPTGLPQLQALLGDGTQFGIRLSYSEQDAPRGIAEALIIAEDFIAGEPVCLMLGDNVIGPAVVRAGGRAPRPDCATVFIKEVSDPREFGVAEIDASGAVTALVEKPSAPSSHRAVIGMYIYGPEASAEARALSPSTRGELEITDLNRRYLARGALVLETLGAKPWFDVGTPRALTRASWALSEDRRRGAARFGCPAWAAFERGLIDRAQLRRLAQADASSSYGAELLADGDSAPASALPEVLLDATPATLPDGRQLRVVPLNNAATTPTFVETFDAVREFMGSYGALHRGAGPRARQTITRVTQAIATIRRFIGCPQTHGLVFTENTSAAINLLARTLAFSADDVILISDIEHTSNNLPWRYNTPAEVIEFVSDHHGDIDYTSLESLAEAHGSRLRLIAISGASNQTGHIPDLARIASLAHRYDCLLFVDGAQLVPHRRVDMAALGVDSLAFSAHKVYAPFGLGVLALPLAVLDTVPVNPGGGSIDMISDHDVIWSPAMQRHQTGTWNVNGIIALAASCAAIERAGWDQVIAHERELVTLAVEELGSVPGLRVHAPLASYLEDDRIGAFPFSLPGYHCALLAAILDHEYGIEVRAGTICNHRLVRRWFDVSDEQQRAVEAELAQGNRLATYGIVRASIGIHNTREDIERLGAALRSVAEHGPRLRYRAVPEQEIYVPE